MINHHHPLILLRLSKLMTKRVFVSLYTLESCVASLLNILDLLQCYILFIRACLITLHSNFEIFQKGHPAVEVMLDRRIFER